MKLSQSASLFVLAVLAIVLAIAAPVHAEEPPAAAPLDREVADFFEREVRPVLMVSCIECHGADAQEAQLRLDAHQHLLKGGDSGPAVVPFNAEESPLVRAVRYDGNIQMPPDAKLPEKAIDALTKWVQMGAPWPDDAGPMSIETAAQSHWAYQRVADPPVPQVQNDAWAQSPIDRFILQKLESGGLQPSDGADRRTLIRRLSIDLTGLPPSPQEVDAFVYDSSPDAIVRLVDRLLESPRFGERWGRYWLDIARYADTKGYVFQEDRSYKYAYVFRDWVIRSLNEDLPYDRFLMYQLAADQLVKPDDTAPLAAMGLLTIGRRFLNNTHDIIDDRIDVVTRGMLGMTVACARCHDHKYDPIPTADYYSLYGVFAASQEATLPLEEPSEAYQQERAQREAAVAEFLRDKEQQLRSSVLARPGAYLAAASEGRYAARDPEYWKRSGNCELSRQLVELWKAFVEAQVKADSPVFGPWHALAALPQEGFAAAAKELCQRYAAGEHSPELNPLIVEIFKDFEPQSFDQVIDRYGQLLARVDGQWKAALAAAQQQGQPAPAELADEPAEQIRLLLHGPGSPAAFASDQTERLLRRGDAEELRKLRAQVTQWSNSDQAPRHAMVMQDKPGQHGKVRILKRGNPGMPGEEVPRQFLRQLAGEDRQPFQHGSGRLELAQAIADPENPLTPRVWANRVWHRLIGRGLVETSSDFGLRSDPPSHPELLDHLATQFVADGWSTKKLVRRIVLSSVYQQSSAHRSDAAAADPENRLVWRMNRRRLDFEALRDHLLAVSAAMDHKLYGTSVDITQQPFPPRRTIYSYIDRQNLPGVFRTFDFASPDSHTPQRFLTTVPQQALYLMNHPFAIAQAQQLITREDFQSQQDASGRIDWIYQTLFARPANEEEIALGRQFVEQAPESDENKLEPWARYAHVLLMSNEFAFVD